MRCTIFAPAFEGRRHSLTKRTKKAVEKKFDKSLVVHEDYLPLPSALKEKPSTKGLGPEYDTTFFDLMQQPKILLPPGRRSSSPSGEDVKRFLRVRPYQTLTMESLILAQDER
jgi:hypothetical protein